MIYKSQIGLDLHEEWKGKGKVRSEMLLLLSLAMTSIVIEP